MKTINLQSQTAATFQGTLENHVIQRFQAAGIQNPHALMVMIKADPEAVHHKLIWDFSTTSIAPDQLALLYDMCHRLARKAQALTRPQSTPSLYAAHI